MKVIPRRQPWATLIARGQKSIETRTHNRLAGLAGQRIAIHAGLRFDHYAHDTVGAVMHLLHTKRPVAALPISFEQACDLAQSSRFPRGCVVAIATVAEAREITCDDSPKALCPCDGKYGLILKDVLSFAHPLGARGGQGIWNWTPLDPLMRIECPKCFAPMLVADSKPDGFGLMGSNIADCPCGATWNWRTSGHGVPSLYNCD